jgi:hypothetical protein
LRVVSFALLARAWITEWLRDNCPDTDDDGE